MYVDFKPDDRPRCYQGDDYLRVGSKPGEIKNGLLIAYWPFAIYAEKLRFA